jgi:hypothetical protein
VGSTSVESITSSGTQCCSSMCLSNGLTCVLRSAVGMIATNFIKDWLSDRLAFRSVGFQIGSQHLSVGAQFGSDARLQTNSEK